MKASGGAPFAMGEGLPHEWGVTGGSSPGGNTAGVLRYLVLGGTASADARCPDGSVVSDPATVYRDAVSIFAYQTAPHLWQTGRDHGHLLGKDDDHGRHVSKEWLPGGQSDSEIPDTGRPLPGAAVVLSQGERDGRCVDQLAVGGHPSQHPPVPAGPRRARRGDRDAKSGTAAGREAERPRPRFDA
jgi:hypothetical protein